MVKKSSIILLLLLFLPITYGITFYQNDDAVLFASCKNLTYADSSAKITVYYPNGTLFIVNNSMNAISKGIFNYTFIAPNITGNYLSSVECNISSVLGYDEDDFWIREKEEEMTSLAVVIFMIGIVAGLFLLPRVIGKLNLNKYLDSTFKGLSIVFALLMLSLTTTMVVTVADNADLGVTQELFRLLWLSNWAIYLTLVVVILSFGYKVLMMWNEDKYNRKMGYNEP